MRNVVLTGALALLGACSFDRSGLDDSPAPADADPNAPDADPNAPDSDPNAPDADPNAPDAAAGSPDAATPDAAPPDAMPILDLDGDGIEDADDNCLVDPNPGQYDEDNDGVGNECDNCPHVANPDQATLDGDLVGDACDPNPDNGDVLAKFDGFNGATLDSGWEVAFGTNSWSVAGGSLQQTGAEVENKGLVWAGFTATKATVDTGIDVVAVTPALPDGFSRRRIGALTNWTTSDPVNGTYGRVGMLSDDLLDASPGVAFITKVVSTTPTFEATASSSASVLAPGFYRVRSAVYADSNGENSSHAVTFTSASGDLLGAASVGRVARPMGRSGVYTFGVTASFRYVVVFTRAF
jgi:hypothetical protein